VLDLTYIIVVATAAGCMSTLRSYFRPDSVAPPSSTDCTGPSCPSSEERSENSAGEGEEEKREELEKEKQPEKEPEDEVIWNPVDDIRIPAKDFGGVLPADYTWAEQAKKGRFWVPKNSSAGVSVLFAAVVSYPGLTTQF
jgi:hypothetical protein